MKNETDFKKRKNALQVFWDMRLELLEKGSKLRANGDEFCAEDGGLCPELYKLRAEGDKFWSEGVKKICGNIKTRWIWNEKKSSNDCEVEGFGLFKC